MNKILIALDYDPTAQKVAEVGYSMAESIGAEIVLLHIVSEPVYYKDSNLDFIDIGPLRVNSLDGLKEHAQLFLEKTKVHLGNKSIKTVVEDGDFATTILSVAKSLHANVIVMGSHSHSWLEEVLMGTVTEEVLHHSTIPVVIVPTKKRD